eukprot:3118196-Lingulodinium_polyedra.AAC.1
MRPSTRPFFAAERLPKRAAAACLADARGEGTRAPALLRRNQRQRSRLPPTRHRQRQRKGAPPRRNPPGQRARLSSS